MYKAIKRRNVMTYLQGLRELITRPVDAVPLDLFRIAVGFLLIAYFFRTYLEAADFSGPDGLIDHGLIRDIFWFTKIGYFQPWMNIAVFQSMFIIGCICAFLLVIGYRVKLSAAILYLIAVSTYRWNFIVLYVDDAIMHLLIFWMLVLPVGKTLTLQGLIRGGVSEWYRWKNTRVPGFALRCLIWNLTLLYLVAGLWKWTSPMWLEGSALYVIFKLPISYSHQFWGPEHIPFLKPFNYITLILEPLIPLMFFLPKGHIAKYLILLPFIGLHLGSVATLDIPFANLACAALPVLVFREELMELFGQRNNDHLLKPHLPPIGLPGAAAFIMVALLTISMVSSISLPSWRKPKPVENALAVSGNRETSVPFKAAPESGFKEAGHEGLGPVQFAFFGALWCMGIAQQYQLFNWIDDRNYTVRYKIIESAADGTVRRIEPAAIFRSSTRGVLLQFYLHGITWARVPEDRRDELKKSLLTRAARRFCLDRKPSGIITVDSSLIKIEPDGAMIEQYNRRLIEFRCLDSEPDLEVISIDGGAG